MRYGLWIVCLSVCLAGCQASPRFPARDIVVASGQQIAVGVPVVLWSDAHGYNAYRSADSGKGHYNDRSKGLSREDIARLALVGWSPELLRDRIDQVVIHYDATGLSRECFRVLQTRGLSAHFLLDLDGTIYQTLDLRERAWHAGEANSRSIGIEIANVGAYAADETDELDAWYRTDRRGRTTLRIPKRYGDGGLRMKRFVAKPARDGLVAGVIQGRELVQYDFTPEQYDALTGLLAGLHGAFPGIALDMPRDAAGRPITVVLSEDELAAFRGVLGHYHVSAEKVDPGPAFDWGRVLGGAAERVRGE